MYSDKAVAPKKGVTADFYVKNFKRTQNLGVDLFRQMYYHRIDVKCFRWVRCMGSRYFKLFLLICLDAFVAICALLVSFFALDLFPTEISKVDNFIYAAVSYPMLFVVFSYIFKSYHVLWRYAVWKDYFRVVIADIMAVVM